MKVLVVVAVVLALAFAESDRVGTMSLVRSVNQKTKLWTASLNSPVARMTRDEIRGLLGAGPEGFEHPSKYLRRKTYTLAERANAPDSYDPREHYNCSSLRTVPDQSACGSCWAVGPASAMGDRVCIGTGLDVILSAEDVLACSGGGGCDGGQPSASFLYWQKDGVVTQECRPYPFPSCDHHIPSSTNPCPDDDYPTPSCDRECKNGASWKDDKHYASDVYYVEGHDDIINELSKNGPCGASFAVYEDFVVYTSGIYHHVSGGLLGYHAVRLLGYGVEGNTKYWLLSNNWNEHWGEKGYFRMLRGNDECGIEDEVLGGIASS